MTKEKKTRWAIAAIFSAAMHLALMLFLAPTETPHEQKPQIISVRLVTRHARRDGGKDSAGKGEHAQSQPNAPQKAAVQRSAKAPTKERQNVAMSKPQPRVAQKIEPRLKQPEPTERKSPTAAQTENDAAAQSDGASSSFASNGDATYAAGEGIGRGREAGEDASSGRGDGDGIRDAASLEVIRKITPEYPLISRKRGETGTAVIIALVVEGSVSSVELESSSGHVRLDASAMKAASGWKFNAPGALRVRIPFAFKIN